MTEKPLPTVEEILARFHRLRITIGLSATSFGYLSIGNAAIIRRMESGEYKPHAANLERMGYCLDELEKGHSIPMREPRVRREQKKNEVDKSPSSKENIPILTDYDLEG